MARCDQVLVHALQIVQGQSANGLFEPQLRDQQVVACFGQLALRVKQLRLGVEDIHIDAHADFVTEFVGFERAEAGFLSRFECADLRFERLRTKVGLACALCQIALGAVFLAARFVFECQFFFHLVLNRKASKNRDV